MAASSSSSSRPPTPLLRNYDAFLNHRGPDVKRGFVDHLSASLEAVGIRSFVDYTDLHAGEDTWDAIESAIRHSKVHIAIFSPGYAESTWCLRELHEILECRTNGSSLLFLPVFFNVAPSDLRYSESPKSCFYAAFSKHLTRNDREVINIWRNALNEASLITGITLDFSAQGFEARLVKLIVSEVLNVQNRTVLYVAKHPVGVNEKLEEALDLMKRGIDTSHEGFHKLGIYGMGGVGKTTLAKSIYNAIYRGFDSFCFMEGVMSKTETSHGLEDVQERMLRALLKTETKIDITSISHGAQIMRDRLRGLKILLILDDVDSRRQLEALLTPLESCHLKNGSQVVITTRNEQIVIWANAHRRLNMQGLREAHAHLLFCWHAFLSSEEPPKEFKDLAKKVINACHGIPLALETLGSHLYAKDRAIWEATVKVLESPRHTLAPAQREVTSVLRITYDGLRSEEKLMFLDIACFMIGVDEEAIKRIWCESETAELCLETLRLKSLVKVDENRRLAMHDLLRDMGREIVECSHKNVWQRSHLWDEDDVRRVLRSGKGSSEVRGVSLNSEVVENWNVKSFAGMDSLKFLLLSGKVSITGGFSLFPRAGFSLFPRELRWFSWVGCPRTSLPRELDLSEVSVLHLPSSVITDLSNGHRFENLRELRLSGCANIRKHGLPDFRVCCKKLEMLDLSYCEKLVGLPESIGCLSSSLTHLDLRGCSGLVGLPESIGFLSSSLTYLDLRGCKKLTRLPDGLVSLHSLKALFLDNCSDLKRLPDAIGQLTALEEIGLTWLNALELLPESVGNLTRLSSLILETSLGLTELPSAIGNLRRLTLFCVRETLIAEIPQAICSLTNLVSLEVTFCRMVLCLPENIGNLRKLVTLVLKTNKGLSCLPPSIGQLEELVTLDVTDCNIDDGGLPEEISNLSSLQHLSLGGNRLSRLPEHFHLFPNLRTFRFEDGWANVREILHLPASLEALYLDCPGLVRHPSLLFLTELRVLVLSKYRGMQLIGLEALSHLKELDIRGCRGLSISVAQQLASLTSLRRLDAQATGLHVGPWIEKLVSLEYVALDGEKLPKCFSRYKVDVPVVPCKPRGFPSELLYHVFDGYIWGHADVGVPRGSDMGCKGLVLCLATLPSDEYSSCSITARALGQERRLKANGKGGQLRIAIYRAATDIVVGSLKGGDTIRVEMERGRELMSPEVALRLMYEDHEIEEMFRELAIGTAGDD